MHALKVTRRLREELTGRNCTNLQRGDGPQSEPSGTRPSYGEYMEVLRVRNQTPVLLVVLLLLCGLGTAEAYPVGSLDLKQLSEQSDWIGVGRVVSVKPGATTTRRETGGTTWHDPLTVQLNNAVLAVEMVLKGETPAGQQLAWRFISSPLSDQPSRGPFFSGFKKGQRLLVCLKTIDGALEPINPMNFSGLVLPDELQLPAVRGTSSLEKLEDFAVGLIEKGDNTVRREVLRLIGHYQARPQQTTSAAGRRAGNFALPETAPRLAALLVSPDRDLRLATAKLLVEYQHLPALPVLVNELAEKEAWYPPGTTSGTGEAMAIEYMFTREALPILYQLMKSPQTFIRQAATFAVWQEGSKESIPYLVAALDDDYVIVRHIAEMALALISGEGKAVSIDAFMKDEAGYINFWKTWWAKRQPH